MVLEYLITFLLPIFGRVSTLLKFLRFTLFGYPRAIDQRMHPLNGGNHGGRIKAMVSTGVEVVAERFAGSSGGTIKFVYNGKTSQSQSEWSQLLGNATGELYNNVYAFSLDELVNLESLSESGVEDKIFSIGLGLGNLSIGEVESNVLKQINNIYITRGKTQIIPSILADIQTLTIKIQRIQDKLPKYEELTKEIEQFRSEIDNINDQLKKLRTGKEKLEDYLKCYDSFVEVVTNDKELESLPELQAYPLNGIEQLDNPEKKEDELNIQIEELQRGSESEKGIEALEEEIKGISFNSELLNHADKLEYLRKNLEKYKQTLIDKNDDDGKITKFNQSITHGLSKIGSEWTEQNITNFTDLISHKSDIEGFKEKFEKIHNDKTYFEAQQKALQTKEGPINANNITITVALIFFILSIPAFIDSHYVWGITFFLISILIFAGKKFLLKKGPHVKIEEQLNDLFSEEENIKYKYEEYLNTRLNLQKSLTVQAISEIFTIVEQIKKEIIEREELKEKQANQRIPFIEEFNSEVHSLKKFVEAPESTENVEVLVNQIITEFDASKNQLQEKEKLQDLLNRKNDDLTRTRSKLEENKKQISQLLSSINATDREDFRKKYQDNNTVKRLIEEKNMAIQTIEKIVGRNKAKEVNEFLKANDLQELRKTRDDLESEISLKTKELNVKNSELGKMLGELEGIEGESELAEVMTELESEKRKLYNAYRDWLTGKIALKIFGEVKQKYEREKQPRVIKYSSTYLSKITDERYKRISVSLEERDVAVFDSKEASKKINQLSRGTKEQLLVSLRLGFIEEYEINNEPLPVVMDEVLVNFDPDRAKRMAEILHEFGENRQILIFTCQPLIKEYFKNLDVNLVRI